MLNLTDKNKALCFEDSVEKPFAVYLYYFDENTELEYGGTWRYFTTIEDIVQESVDLTEGILEGETFSLGSIVAPTLKISWVNTGVRYKNLVAIPVQQIGTQYIAYFDGFVARENISDDGLTVEAEIQSFLTNKLDKTISKELISAYNNGTVAELINGAIGQSLGVWVDDTHLEREFSNARIKMSFPTDSIPDTVTLSDFLKQAGEFIGGQWYVAEKRIVTPQELRQYQPSTMILLDLVRIADIDTACLNDYNLLPDNYKLLPYIETTGSQYIRTDIYPNDTTKIDIKFQIKEPTGGSIIGNGSGTETDSFRFFNYNGGAYLDYGSGEGYNRISSSNQIYYRIYHLEIGNRYVKDLDTNRYILNADKVTFDEKTYPINIFGHSTKDLAKMKLYSCSIFKNNVIVGYLIPCHNTTTNTYGVYNATSGEFYSLLGDSSTAVIPRPIQSVSVPWYISLKYDKTSKLNFTEIDLTTKTINGYERYYYDYHFGSNTNDLTPMTYTIENNLFYEGAVYDDRFLALEEVATYLKTLNFSSSSLSIPYVHYAEPTDYITISPPEQKLLPGTIYETMTDINGEVITDINGSAIETIIEKQRYVALESITLKNNFYEQPNKYDKNIRPMSDDITIEISFELLGSQTSIFVFENSDVLNGTSLTLASDDGKSLYLRAGYYGSSIQIIPLQIDYVPPNQKIDLKLHFFKGELEYSGSYSGKTTYYTIGDDGKFSAGGSGIPLLLGSIGYTSTSDPDLQKLYPTNTKIYHFYFSQILENGEVQEYNIIPAYDKLIGKPIFYDVYSDYQLSQEQLNNGYSNSIKVIPLLSTQAQGIVSQMATIDSKATTI